jgi:hypothetical protein
MYDPTNTIRRLAAALFATAAMVIAVPVAQGFDGPPDAIDRYRANNEVEVASTLPLGGSPDAIDRYRQNHALVTQPSTQGSPDAIDRYNATQALLSQPSIDGPPDALDRYLGRTEVGATVASTSEEFHWGDFGIGAAAMFGLAMLLAGLGLGALAVRHRGGQLRTS